MEKQAYTCRICGEKFDSAEEREMHNLSVHPEMTSGAEQKL